MYTKMKAAVSNDHWAIYCPQGIYICLVYSESDADGLLSHLNR